MTALNFPANPTNGQTYENYVYDGTDGVWKRISPGGTLGNIDDVTINAPADGESLVYDSATGDWINADATVEVYGVNTAETDYFMIPVGGDADRPVTPANGHIRFNSDSGEPEYYSEAESSWFLFRQEATTEFSVEYLAVAGGGGGGYAEGGGGGAGGYRSNVSGEFSGGGASAESSFIAPLGTTYTITVGAGGAGSSGSSPGSNGSNSVFSTITSTGGGGGGGYTSGSSGGSGGGARQLTSGVGSGTANQGYAGGSAAGVPLGGGGGGAFEAGNTDGQAHGGDGVVSGITGASVTRAGGGGGGATASGGTYPGGDGGGGAGGANVVASPGSTNTGGGGGGGSSSGVVGANGAAGGSGIVILKYPSSVSLTVDPGLASITNTVGDYKVTQFTAGTGDVTFS